MLNRAETSLLQAKVIAAGFSYLLWQLATFTPLTFVCLAGPQ
jgi:hypothetical protein